MNREICRLAVPAIVSNITVPLLSLVDITIVGHMGDASFLGAISVGAMIFNVIYWLFGFLRMGSSGLTAQAYGSGDFIGIQKMYQRTLILSCGIGMLFIVLLWPLRELSLLLMQTGDGISHLVRTYFNICILGAPAVLGQFALNGWLIGMQNTRIPMRVAILQNIINIILSILLVYGCGMMIEGVALGTMLSQWSAFTMLYIESKRLKDKEISNGSESRFKLRDLFGEKDIKEFFKVNSDIFIRTLCLVAVNLYFTSAGSAQGTIILAANTILMTFFTVFSYVMDGFAYAGEALGGKYYGANSMHDLQRLHAKLMGWGTGMVACFTVVYFLGGKDIIQLLTSDDEVRAIASGYIGWTLIIPAAGVWAFIYDGLFIGMTRTRQMLYSCAIGALAFFTLYFTMRSSMGNNALWLALVVYLLLRGAVLSAAFYRISRSIPDKENRRA